MSRVRLIPIVLIVLITLGILVAGYQTYRHLNFINPLQTRLQQNPAVTTVQIVGGNPAVIRIGLKSVSKLNNEDLQTTYHRLMALVESTTNAPVQLQFIDQSDKTLTSDYEQMAPILYQGLRKGNYTQMIAEFKQQAAKDGIQSSVTMDQQNVYVELWDSSNHYLYDVITYQVSQGGGAA